MAILPFSISALADEPPTNNMLTAIHHVLLCIGLLLTRFRVSRPNRVWLHVGSLLQLDERRPKRLFAPRQVASQQRPQATRLTHIPVKQSVQQTAYQASRRTAEGSPPLREIGAMIVNDQLRATKRTAELADAAREPAFRVEGRAETRSVGKGASSTGIRSAVTSLELRNLSQQEKRALRNRSFSTGLKRVLRDLH